MILPGTTVTIANRTSIYWGYTGFVQRISGDEAAVEMLNSITWNNTPDNIYENGGLLASTYSNIQGGWEGEGNIDADPQFTDPENAVYTLQSTSPCIDAGDPNSELDPDGTRADMGAYPYKQYQNSIDLHNGNNLISFYAIPKDNSVSNVLSSLDNATGLIGEVVAAQIIIDTWFGSLTEVTHDKGYWLDVINDSLFALADTAVTNLELLAGHESLIGVLSRELRENHKKRSPEKSSCPPKYTTR